MLDVAAFGRNKALKDGLSFYCLECNRERNNEWYRESRRRMGKEVRDLSWVPEGFRWCAACQQAVAHEDYTRNSGTSSGFGSRCRACDRAENSASYFYRRYGLTKRQLGELRDAQGNRCAICGEASPQHLDHDHATAGTRALLCQRCNQGLGLLRDDPAVLRAAADYVEEHRRRQAGGGARPLAARRPEAVSRPVGAPVGSGRRPGTRRTGLCERGRGLPAAREADG
jgi:hypothetical protein